MHKGYSPQSIQRKLREEYVEVEMEFITNILNEYQTTPTTQIQYLIEKKTRHISSEELVDFNFRKKLLRYLISKGHDLSLASKEIEKKIRRQNDEVDEDNLF